MSFDDDLQRRRWTDIVNLVGVEVRQALTSYQLTLQRLDVDMQAVKTTLYGNPAFEQPGLVKDVRAIDGKLDQIIKQREQMTWLMRGVAAGLTLNFLQLTGVLPALLKLLP